MFFCELSGRWFESCCCHLSITLFYIYHINTAFKSLELMFWLPVCRNFWHVVSKMFQYFAQTFPKTPTLEIFQIQKRRCIHFLQSKASVKNIKCFKLKTSRSVLLTKFGVLFTCMSELFIANNERKYSHPGKLKFQRRFITYMSV